MTTIATYDAKLEPARRLLASDPKLLRLLSPTIERDLLLRFLIEYCARAVQMTEPVEGWIRRAGERCIAIGLDGLGRSLMMHSKHEADHHLMLIDDVENLVTAWNREHAHALDAKALVRQHPSTATRRYVRLHEDAIAGDEPYAQIAIELEIEALSVVLGPPLIGRCLTVIGEALTKQLSFVREHVAVDVGHSALNRKMMKRLLDLRPDALDAVVEAGTQALRTYVRFLGECLDNATEDLAVAAPATPTKRRRASAALSPARRA